MTATSSTLIGRKDFSLHIDFDSTLFHTKRFANDLWQEVAALAGLPYEQVAADVAKFQINPRLRGYDFASHMASYGLPVEQLWHRIDEMIRDTDYLYPDSVAFIQHLRADGFNPCILSFGEKRFQEAKITAAMPRLLGGQANTDHQLIFVVVDCSKSDHLAKAHPGAKGALVDDVPNQELPAGFTEIHLDRSLDLAEPQAKPGGYTVCNLEQARQVIQYL